MRDPLAKELLADLRHLPRTHPLQVALGQSRDERSLAPLVLGEHRGIEAAVASLGHTQCERAYPGPLTPHLVAIPVRAPSLTPLVGLRIHVEVAHGLHQRLVELTPHLATQGIVARTATGHLRQLLQTKTYTTLDGQAARAARSSSSTDLSDSTARRDDNAALASADPTLPSAQAACERTNGSGSESAAESTGTASGDPQLPSPTQTLRAKPARPDRRIGDPLENESQAASSSATSNNSIKSGEAVPGCEVEAPGSDSTPNGDRKSTRLNSSHVAISYAVFCLKKKKHEKD